MKLHFATHQLDTSKTDDLTLSSQNSDCNYHNEIPLQQQFQKHNFTPRLSKMFDRYKITDTNGVYIIMTITETFERDTENFVINRTFFQRIRKKYKEMR